MNNFFEDGSTLEENIIIVRKELLRLAEEKLANNENNDTIRKCVEYRKMKVKEVEYE